MPATPDTSANPGGLLFRLPGVRFAHERTIWAHRRLLLRMVASDLRSRYVATSMGFFWSVIHPFLLLLVYIFVFSFVFAARWDGLGFTFEGNFAVFLCCGLLPWTWFQESLSGAAGSVVANGPLLKRSAFPAVILPIQPILSGFVHFSVAFGLFLIYRIAVHGVPVSGLLWLPGIVLLQVAVMLGPALLLATVNVFWRDVAQILVSVLTIGFWLTPILYVPVLFQAPITARFGEGAYQALLWVFWLNPAYHLVSLYQRALYFTATPPWQPDPALSVAVLVAIAALTWFGARRLYGRARDRMPEML